MTPLWNSPVPFEMGSTHHVGDEMDAQFRCESTETFDVRFIVDVTREVLRPDDKRRALSPVHRLPGQLGVDVESGAVTLLTRCPPTLLRRDPLRCRQDGNRLFRRRRQGDRPEDDDECTRRHGDPGTSGQPLPSDQADQEEGQPGVGEHDGETEAWPAGDTHHLKRGWEVPLGLSQQQEPPVTRYGATERSHSSNVHVMGNASTLRQAGPPRHNQTPSSMTAA